MQRICAWFSWLPFSRMISEVKTLFDHHTLKRRKGKEKKNSLSCFLYLKIVLCFCFLSLSLLHRLHHHQTRPLSTIYVHSLIFWKKLQRWSSTYCLVANGSWIFKKEQVGSQYFIIVALHVYNDENSLNIC